MMIEEAVEDLISLALQSSQSDDPDLQDGAGSVGSSMPSPLDSGEEGEGSPRRKKKQEDAGSMLQVDTVQGKKRFTKIFCIQTMT